ncbi:DHH family phosphoesterase [Singulisphaera acidiphila]|uniref:Exopolyphosphatase-like enzyme n=1 Tax=Singulisphaera acidiphila (strain ATCC BAA-1392 / DSM 18658 / VKM B-2454 / MOB10) TaxID=886293 RepID=L0DPY1_SINAD|nr:bifunctional oligoribonuclease/PAP phosphatase NrnA [Singulisphaera acidiphila]AGA30751.1 exopolyphosphatase-like enzyme [Singulisphaera acidiphila DSM 18658]
MSIDWTPLADLIETHDRFLLTTHVRPDGDALGSEVGMAGLLRQRGKDVRVVNSSRTPPRYDFLDPQEDFFEHFGSLANPADLADREVAIILDLSAWSQLGDMADLIRDFKGPRVVIDHHVSQDDLGALFLKDTTAEATGTLVVQATKALGGTFTKEVATGLLTAIAMDTGWFHHPNTKPSTLRTVADLVEAGAPINEIYSQLFERSSLGRLRLMGETLTGLKTVAGGRIAYATVTRDSVERSGAIPQDTEDLVDFTVSLKGVEVGMLFFEQSRGGIKLSLRSRQGMDCARLAGLFGGGGHRAAAGATLPDPLDESIERVLAAVQQTLNIA